MKKGYVFLSNSTKPTAQEQYSKEEIKLTNVSRPCLKSALDMGYDVFFGTNRHDPEKLACELPVHKYDSHSYRSITSIKDNWVAFKNLRKIIKENNIDVIHCNTPVGGMIGRLCGKLYHINKVIYTAHGFHFYKGAPLINRTIYKWAEQLMAHWTDVIITMKQEDFEAAKRFHLIKKGKVYKVHGVGITLSDINDVNIDKSVVRYNLGLKDSDIVCISAGDLVARKNYQIAIKAIAKTKNPNIHYLICGTGEDLDRLKRLAQNLKIADRIHFLGYRTDVIELYKASDIFLFTTLQEGLPRSLMEAMACGLPCIVSNIRGNVDLIKDGKGGFLCNPQNPDAFTKAINLCDADTCHSFGSFNLDEIKKYDIAVVKREIQKIYKESLR